MLLLALSLGNASMKSSFEKFQKVSAPEQRTTELPLLLLLEGATELELGAALELLGATEELLGLEDELGATEELLAFTEELLGVEAPQDTAPVLEFTWSFAPAPQVPVTAAFTEA